MVSIPHELCDAQCDVCLYIDIVYVNGMPFLTTISKNIKYHKTMWVADCTAPTISSLVESILKIYQWAGFQVMEVCINHKFKPVLQVLQDNGWSFMTNLANTQELVREAEHNNRILKECIQATYHGIPYKMLLQTIICHMVMETAAKLNYFPAKGGSPITSAQGKFSIMSSLTTSSTVPYLFSVMFSFTMNQPLPSLLVHIHWIVFSYAPFKQSKVGMNVIIFLLTRASHDLMSLLFPQPPL